MHTSRGLEIRPEGLNSPGLGEIRVEFGDLMYTTLAGPGVPGVAERNPVLLQEGRRLSSPAERST